MICQRCLFRAARSSSSVGLNSNSSGGAAVKFLPRTLHRRQYALKANANETPAPANPAKPRGPATETHEGRPAATSSSAAQPFSAREDPPGSPRSPKAQKMDPSGAAEEIESLPRVKSSVAAGQPLPVSGTSRTGTRPLPWRIASIRPGYGSYLTMETREIRVQMARWMETFTVSLQMTPGHAERSLLLLEERFGGTEIKKNMC